MQSLIIPLFTGVEVLAAAIGSVDTECQKEVASALSRLTTNNVRCQEALKGLDAARALVMVLESPIDEARLYAKRAMQQSGIDIAAEQVSTRVPART